MRKLLLAFAALPLMAVSCRDIQETDFLADGALTLTASVEQPVGTRTLVAGAGEVFWEKGDNIKVFAGTASGKFMSNLESISSTAEFTGSLGGAWTDGSPLWAVYPYNEGASLDGEVLTAELPAVQTARGMSFAKDMNLSVARSTTASLQFYNVGGGVCFTLKEGGIQKVVFEGLDGEILAGKVKLAFVEDRPAVQEVVEGSTTVTLAAPEGETLEGDGVWYYIVALPGTLEKGFKLSFYKGNTVAQKTFSKTVTVKRSIYGEVRNADEGASYIPDTDENITFKDAKVKEIVVRYFDTGKDGELSYKEAAAVRSFYVAKTRAAEDSVSVFAGTDITTFDEIIYFTGLTKIEDGAFAGCTQLTSITIPANITEIGANAFKGCTSLQSITVLSETPPTIGEDAFADTNNCPIIVPAGTTETYVTAWGEYAPRIEGSQPDNEIWYTTTDGQTALLYYNDFYGLTTEECFGASIVSHQYRDGKGVITFDKALTFLGKRAFTESSNLASMALPNSIKSIGEYAFIGCSALAEITLPNSLETIGDLAFRACYALESISIPKTVTTIPYSAFTAMPGLSSICVDPENPVFDSRENCNAIIETETNRLIVGCKNTIIPESVTSIGQTAFYGCSGLTELMIPNSVTEICATAFCQSGIEHVVIPASVKSIDAYVFQGCANLVTLVIEGSPATIGRYAFRDCNSLAYFKIYSETPPQAGNDFLGNTHNCPIYVPSGSVEAYKTASVWKSYASRIQGFEVNPQPDNKIVYTSSDGLVVSPKHTLAELTDEECFGAKILSNEYTDGRGVINFDGYVKSIGLSAFYGCETLTDVVIPYGVSSIGKSAFSLCSNLGSVTLPESVTSIGEVAFGYCTRLTKIDIPSKVKSLEYAALMYCSSLTDITIPEGFTTIGKEALRYCSSLEHICLPASLTSIGEKAFGGCNNLVSITIPKKVAQIGKESFLGVKELVRVKIEGATEIGEYAFQSCKKLTSITILDPGVSFGKKAFTTCTGLNSIKIYSSTPPVGGQGMFDYSTCPIYVPAGSEDAYKSAPYWSDYADRIRGFEGEYQPEYEIWYTATTPGLVMCLTGTGYGANFVTNSYRTSEEFSRGIITFDDSITAIIDRAFSGKSNLATIQLPESVMTLGQEAFKQCGNMTAIVLPDCITQIGQGAFSGCTSLVHVTLPPHMTTLSANLFYGCSSLMEISLPESVTTIGNQAFASCSSLTRITVRATNPPAGGSSMFDGSTCPIYVPAGSVDAYKTAQYWSEYADRIQAIQE